MSLLKGDLALTDQSLSLEQILVQIPDPFAPSEWIDPRALPIRQPGEQGIIKREMSLYNPLAIFIGQQWEPVGHGPRHLKAFIQDAYTIALGTQPVNSEAVFGNLLGTSVGAAIKASDYFNQKYENLVQTSSFVKDDTKEVPKPGISWALQFLYGAMAGLATLRVGSIVRAKSGESGVVGLTNKHQKATICFAAQMLTFGPKAIFTCSRDANQLTAAKGAMLMEYAKIVTEHRLKTRGDDKMPWAVFDNTRVQFLKFLYDHGWGTGGDIDWVTTTTDFASVFSLENVANMVMDDIALVIHDEDSDQYYPCLEAPPP